MRDHHGCDGLPTAHLLVVRVWLYAPRIFLATGRRRRGGDAAVEEEVGCLLVVVVRLKDWWFRVLGFGFWV